jgi:hypothetical protein
MRTALPRYMTTVEAITASKTLGKLEHGLKTNTGATGTVTVRLPAAVDCKGLPPLRFMRTAAYTFAIDPTDTDVIYDSDGVSLGAGVAKSLTATGARCDFVSDGTYWYAINERPTPVGAIGDGSIATAKLAAGAVVGTKVGLTGIVSGGFTGSNGTGACTLTGATVGQRVLILVETTATVAVGVAAALFEATITIADQIQQSSAANNSAKRYVVVLLPVAA